MPCWTPDGRRVAFSWFTKGLLTVWWMAADGSGKAQELTRGKSEARGSSWMRDGKYLAFVDGSSQADVKVLRMADRTVIPFAATSGRADDHPCRGPGLRRVVGTRRGELGEPEVQNLHALVAGDEYVLRLPEALTSSRARNAYGYGPV